MLKKACSLLGAVLLHCSVPANATMTDVVEFNSPYSFVMLDHTDRVNKKIRYQLDQYDSEALKTDKLYIGAAIIGIIDAQDSNRHSKFGYLMRHPGPSNQIGNEVSEAVLHNFKFHFTGAIKSWAKFYGEVLYDPEQSFGSGTITTLSRNQLQLRRAYALFGDKEKSSFYFALGKMDTPFGLTDTVNPFTSSSVWHAFAGLAYGAQLGYDNGDLGVTLMAVQGGAQFRSINTPIQNTNVPSRLNNFVANIDYTFHLDCGEWLFGASYLHGSAYCQGFPITHFSPCFTKNPAWDVYSKLQYGRLLIQGEYASTFKSWVGTHNPSFPLNRFPAHKAAAFGGGARLDVPCQFCQRDVSLSLDFTQFDAGPDDSPWDRQGQFVFGISTKLYPTVKLFAEYARVFGYAPLNNISGNGPDGPGTTVSDNSARTNVYLLGTQIAI